MSLPTSEADWLAFLALRHDAEKPTLQLLNAHYEGTQPLTYMQPDILREVGDRIRPVIVHWPQLAVDSLEERLDPKGFRLPDQDSGDDDLWRVWQANNLDEESQMGRVDALVMKRSFLSVGTNEDDRDTPLVTVESPLETYAFIDPRTRKVLAALKRTAEPYSFLRTVTQYATLYLPDKTVWYDWGTPVGASPQTTGWREQHRDEHNLGEVSIVPLVNRARVSDRYGRSELDPILPLSDAACKVATDMMVAAEFHAIPLRAIFGVGPDELVDQQGNQLSALQVIMGKLLAVPTESAGEVKPHEFSASSLANFHETLNALAKIVASIAGLPPHYLGFTTDNPASADAIRSSEARLVKRAERKQVTFGGAYENVMQLVRRFQAGEWDPRLKRLETDWRDASTPTVAQAADAVVKKHAEGIITTRQAREDLGYTDAQVARMGAEDLEQQATLFKLPTAADQIAGGQPAATQSVVTGGNNNPAAA